MASDLNFFADLIFNQVFKIKRFEKIEIISCPCLLSWNKSNSSGSHIKHRTENNRKPKSGWPYVFRASSSSNWSIEYFHKAIFNFCWECNLPSSCTDEDVWGTILKLSWWTCDFALFYAEQDERQRTGSCEY